MFKLLVLCLAILALVCAVQSNPTPVRRDKPSSKPRDVVRRDRPSSKPKRDAVRRDRPSPRPRAEAVAKRERPSPRPRAEVAARWEKPSPRPRAEVAARWEKPSPRPRAEVVARWEKPSPRPRAEGVVARGLCDFHCPDENMVGMGLSTMYTDSGRLYCGYDIEGVDDNAFCKYNWNTGELISNASPFDCDQQAVFHCPGTKNGQEEMKWSPSPPQDSRSVNLPQFVKARSMARRAAEEDAA